MITVENTAIPEVKIITPKVFGDHRGWFMETYSERDLKEYGIDVTFVQDNRSFSAQKGTLRGLHFQRPPMTQAKLLTCLKGEILDVAADLRKDSPTYLKWVAVKLTEENKKQLFIPEGFAHGFLTLTDNVEIMYKCNAFYAPECDAGIRFNDPSVHVDWGIEHPILSEKDQNAPFLSEIDNPF